MSSIRFNAIVCMVVLASVSALANEQPRFTPGKAACAVIRRTGPESGHLVARQSEKGVKRVEIRVASFERYETPDFSAYLNEYCDLERPWVSISNQADPSLCCIAR